MQEIEALKSEAAAGAEIELDDLALTDEDADRIKGGSEPVNDRKSPYHEGSLNHNETVLR